MTAKLYAIAAGRRVRSRDELSFTKRNGTGCLQNWCVPHDPKASWHQGLELGKRHFSEVQALAAVDEQEAYYTITCALNSPGWSSSGWGIECGFSDQIASAAIIGLRKLREGGKLFDPDQVERELRARRSAAAKAGWVRRRASEEARRSTNRDA